MYYESQTVKQFNGNDSVFNQHTTEWSLECNQENKKHLFQIFMEVSICVC